MSTLLLFRRVFLYLWNQLKSEGDRIDGREEVL